MTSPPQSNNTEKDVLSSDRSLSTDSLEINSKLEKQAVRMLDYTIVPVMTMFYFLSFLASLKFLSRISQGNARVAGLQADLGLSDHQYQICVTVLYVPYICAELPSNLLLRKIGPKYLMPTLLTIWGVIVTLQGLVSSYAGLVVLRAVLGLVEGPMFPGIVLYLSGFYTREELSLRIALFFSSASLSGAFSGLLAAAIQNMDGIGGKAGWAWIFILEGLFSVLMGVAGFFLVPSTPRDSKFLTREQKEIIMRRLERDRPSIVPQDSFSLEEIYKSLSSIHVILVFIIFFMLGTTLYGLALFLPSIVKQLGFSSTKSQLLSVGPFAAGFFLTLLFAYVSDKYRVRAIPTILITILSVAGWSMYLATERTFVAYGSMYLTVPGVYASAPVISAWMANNSEPYYRRATSVAVGFVATNAGGILSTWRFPTKEGPHFTKTTIMNLVFAILTIVLSILNALILHRKNVAKRRRRNVLLAPYTEDKRSDGGIRAWMELGDEHPDFIYSL
ncbi:hypothetical protein AMATHDRAFT_137753 [Amanita thiersii Skay4041]|uniref:Major facilitator superfamily (MFS) profile domain-containing protein n=1 Tax=Amanita thiersii Skay4041 TaxID=703135 RepID=A0A2A9NXW0_9AGAR|nr:hypothetical protein AMATHDRAFT_137753 [Amanita thiersii Skay4041]